MKNKTYNYISNNLIAIHITIINILISTMLQEMFNINFVERICLFGIGVSTISLGFILDGTKNMHYEYIVKINEKEDEDERK